MPQSAPLYLELFDAKGQPRGAWISPELWDRVKTRVQPILDEAVDVPGTPSAPPQRPEPIAEWETLLAYWDFTYPPDFDVTCDCCGAATANWTEDDPRKFRLRAANLGGLVTFQCQQCHALILKKHFKKHLTVECQPYIERK